MKMTSEQLKGMKHYLLSSLPDTPPLTTSCEQVKKGNEEMISISSLPFSYPLPLPYSTPSALYTASSAVL